MAQRSEDGVGKTREMTKRLERATPVWTRSAISIQASSRDDGCINRPDTRKHLNLRCQTFRITPLYPAGRPHTVIRSCREEEEAGRLSAGRAAQWQYISGLLHLTRTMVELGEVWQATKLDEYLLADVPPKATRDGVQRR